MFYVAGKYLLKYIITVLYFLLSKLNSRHFDAYLSTKNYFDGLKMVYTNCESNEMEVFNNKHVQNTVIKKTFPFIIGENFLFPIKIVCLVNASMKGKLIF